MNEEKIKKMRKDELLKLIEETLGNIETINTVVLSFQTEQEAVELAKNEIIGIDGQSGALGETRVALKEIEEKLDGIRAVHSEILEDTATEQSLKTQIEEVLASIESSKEKVDAFEKKVFGEHKKDTRTGQMERIDGLSQQVETFFDAQRERYTIFYKQIEDELKSGVTSVNLSKSFTDKVGEYHKSGILWSWLFGGLLALVTIYYGLATFYASEITEPKQVWLHLLFRAPFLGFVVWLGVFLGNRRAESKKLEEAYKHKEVMARSFIGYRKTLEEMEESAQGTSLLQEHMRNLLGAMKVDSSEFLGTEGEKHPFIGLMNGLNAGKKTK